MALFWHGHFASNEAKVRDYRKLLGQLELFEKQGTGNFRDLTVAVAQDPAMLSFLDAGVNVKGASNENFAREIMELFTMGPGNYTEKDIREAARAFTGWNYVDLKFVVNKDQHDDGEKTFLGKTGHLDGVDVIDSIMQQPVTAELHLGQDLSLLCARGYFAGIAEATGRSCSGRITLRDRAAARKDLPLARFLQPRFGRHAYQKSRGTRRQHLPEARAQECSRGSGFQLGNGRAGATVVFAADGGGLGWRARAGSLRACCWSARNFARDILFPDISFLPPDRYTGSGEVRRVAERIREGMDISSRHHGRNEERRHGGIEHGAPIAMRTSTRATAVSAARRWRLSGSNRSCAIWRRSNLTRHGHERGSEDTDQAVDYLIHRFMRVPPGRCHAEETDRVPDEGTGHVRILRAAQTYMEQPLRLVLHLIMSQPEFQLS